MSKDIRKIINDLNKLNESEEDRLLNIQRIDETTLNRVFTKHFQDGFIIITSYRFDKDKKTNETDFKELKNLIKQNGYGFIPVYGGFIEKSKNNDITKEVYEPALIVPNQHLASIKLYSDSENLKNLGIELCKKFNQDAVLYKPKENDEIAYFLDKNGNIINKFNSKVINDLSREYFTKLKNGNGRFTFLYLTNSPKSLSESWVRYGEHFYNLK
jgi:hypothetical protein